jgi:signal transduction histidine kinase
MVLEDKTLSVDTLQWVNMIKSSATNSLQILNDTLNISQIQSGTIQLNMAQTDYIKFIEESRTMNKYLADKKKQTLVFESSINSVTVSIDKARLLQVINNLLTNAIKYSNPNTTITIKVDYADDAHTQIKTQVIDQGLGIEEKYHAKLFDPFTTTNNKPTNNESKTGLGLAIVKKIVELHQGSIDFTSEVGKGSNFFFTIPVVHQ